jgi:hypothetical protein
MVVPRTQQVTNRVFALLKWKILFVLLILVGVGVQAWAAGQWSGNFDSDEATFGLMARHVLQGEWPTFVYGNRYLGSTEAILAAPFLYLMGNHVLIFRLSTIMLYALFLSLHALLIARWFGRKAALFSLLFLIIPGWRILWWTFRPIGPYAVMFVLGTFILLLGTRLLCKRPFHPLALCLLGLAIGIALWTHQMSIPYILALAALFLLLSPEWRALYMKGAKWSAGLVGKAAVLLPLLFVATLFALFILAFFSSSCLPVETFALVRTVSLLSLALIVGVLVAALFAISKRRKALLVGGLLITVGIILGTTPLWANALLTGETPAPALWPSCPTELPGRMQILTRELIPGMFGLPVVASIPGLHPLQLILWGIVALFIGAAVLYFLWRYAAAVASLFILRPLHQLEPAIAVVILLIIPLSLAALGSNTVDVLSIRYLLVPWHASAIILGIFLAVISRRSPLLASIFIILWVYQLGFVNLRDIHRLWESRYDRFSFASIAILEQVLEEEQLTSGYADYWTAYALDYLGEERFILAPYNGVDRYPSYTEHVATHNRVALVFPVTLLPEEVSTLQEVQEILRGFTIAGPAFPEFHSEIENRHLEKRFQVGRWDIWILTR